MKTFALPSSSLALASLVNHVFTKRTRLAQEALAYLLQNDLPSQEYFLVRLAQNPRVTAGVRILAALHLLWIGYNVEIGERILRNVDEDQLGPSDKPVYYLLRAMPLLRRGKDIRWSPSTTKYPRPCGECLGYGCLDELMDSKSGSDGHAHLDIGRPGRVGRKSPPFSLIPLVGDEADDAARLVVRRRRTGKGASSEGRTQLVARFAG